MWTGYKLIKISIERGHYKCWNKIWGLYHRGISMDTQSNLASRINMLLVSVFSWDLLTEIKHRITSDLPWIHSHCNTHSNRQFMKPHKAFSLKNRRGRKQIYGNISQTLIWMDCGKEWSLQPLCEQGFFCWLASCLKRSTNLCHN